MDSSSFSNLERSFNRHLERARCTNHPGKKICMCFSKGCRKPNLGLRQAYSTFPPKRLYQELRREGRDRRRKVLKKMGKFDLSSLQASSTPPAWSSIVRINPPTWGQLKQLTQKAQQMVSNTGKPPSVANVSSYACCHCYANISCLCSLVLGFRSPSSTSSSGLRR